MKVVEGDIVLVDPSLTYDYHPFSLESRVAIVLWNGYNGQPLLTSLGKWEPYWDLYSSISKVIGHIDLDVTLRKSLEEFNHE